MDLPTDGEKLQHYTLQRPRPNRTLRQPPKKPHVLPSEINKVREDIVCTTVDEGIDDFFSRKHEIEIEKAPSEIPVEPVVISSGSRTLKKKIGEFFALRKPRSTKSFKFEKDSESDSVTVRGKKQILTDILKPLGKGGENTKENDKGDNAISAEGKSVVDPTWTPDAARRIKPRYAREGKSQSLILLSGEDEESIGIKKKLYEKSEACSTFEHRVHSMLHRIGVMRVLSSETKKKQGKDGEIKKAGSEGDIVDSESHPPTLNARTQSLSTDRTTTPTTAESTRKSDEDFAKQLKAELKNKCLEIQASPRKCDVTPQDIKITVEKSEDSKSLPGLERVLPVSSPSRIILLEGATKGKKDISESIKTDDLLKPRLHLKHLHNRRAVSVHEDQFRNHGFTSELENVKVPLLQRSPVLRLKQRSEAPLLLSSEPASTSVAQESEKGDLEDKPASSEPAQVMVTEGNVTHSPVETVQNAAICQRTAIKPSEPPSDNN
ncbi:capping protein, Arp2/3 and myosin-I linker protein 2-like isoform X2 [Hyperolius riggenbachi]|uniref:capping protein, Arp2/3 and myosin-I linker protein 2-like isoform X2 n=1 Tax=Hyperolius riggenbachi TaxID=752182 RepID=UPI0035A29224